MIDGKAYKATAEKQKSEANQAVYNVAVPEIGLRFTTTLTVSEGQELAMKLSDIREEGTKNTHNFNSKSRLDFCQ